MQQVLKLFDDKIADWFLRHIGVPTKVQEEGWPAIESGMHTLISAPTGTGKTLAAFLVFIDQLHALERQKILENKLYVLYISPLKALGNDIQKNLTRPLMGIPCPEIRVGIRTGDTEASERRRMVKRPPHILITTPESLFLLLSSKTGQSMLKSTRAVIIDELHSMIDTKRGAHLMLSLARLDALCGKSIQRIALSATIKPLDQAAVFLGGTESVHIITPRIHKDVDIEVQSVVPDMRVLPNGTIWPEIASTVYDFCRDARSVIAFVESRAQAEKLAHSVNVIAGAGFARTHHGCVSKEQRLEAENQLKSGMLRLLCATSSMELGIDVGEVDLVLQIGCPLTVAGTLQRLGRAGHNPGRVSVMRVFPRMASEILFCGMTAQLALRGEIEPAHPPQKCLDIVSQHIVSMAAMKEYTEDELLHIIRSAHSFRDVTREDLLAVLRMLAGDFEHELDHPAKPRILYDRIHGTIQGDNYSRMLAVASGGTIPDRGWYPAVLEDGTRLGELDEEYVFEARVGDKFLLGAFAWRIREIRKDRVVVAPAPVEGAQIPFWKGDGRGRAYETGLKFGAYLRGLNEAHVMGKLPHALYGLGLDQAAVDNCERPVLRQIDISGCLPDDKTILLEHFSDEAGEHQLMVHSIFGRRVNMGLEMLMQRAAQQVTGLDVKSFCDDDGFLLYLMGVRDIPDGLFGMLKPEDAEPLLRAMLPATPLFSMLFRYNAARALMMGVRNGGRQPLWIQRMRSAEVLSDVAGQYAHPLIHETMRECMEDYLDIGGLQRVLADIRSGAIALHEFHTEEASPMALPLRRQVEAALMYEYSPIPSSAQKASRQALEINEMIAPAQELLDNQTQRKKQPANADQLHSLLMAEGDIIAGEVDAPIEWLESLAMRDRALYIEPGLWICAEQAEQYEKALVSNIWESQLRIARRCMRYRGAQSADTLSERYLWPEEQVGAILEELKDSGVAVLQDGYYYHEELYRKAQRETIAMRRNEAETLPPERYAALLGASVRNAGSPLDQLKCAMRGLTDYAYPADIWESTVLPARVAGYRPRLLDELLSQGEYFWKIEDEEKRLIRFYHHGDIDWDNEVSASEAVLTEDGRMIMDVLRRRGASFTHMLAPLLKGKSALDVLMELMQKGLVHADSFVPVRVWGIGRANNMDVKRRSRTRVAAQDSGRWEITQPIKSPTLEERLDRAFDQYMILCRETSGDIQWSAALEVLRIWEYTGRVRRGYFVRGLSGAQFIRDKDYHLVLSMMNHPSVEIVWLNAIDPAQAWGKILSHVENASFLCVAGTAVALSAGKPIAVLERYGENLRIINDAFAEKALSALAHDFELKRIYPSLKSLVIKQYSETTADALVKAGFTREMRDYVLWRNIR